MQRTFIVTAILAAVLVSAVTLGIQTNVALKVAGHRSTELRELTDVERWKVFLYEHSITHGLSYREFRLLREIVRAESTWRMYGEDGSVLRGTVNKQDLGLAQINEFYHQKVADELGYDIHSPEGNLKMLVYLYLRDGTSPWVYSQVAWAGKIK